MRIDAVIEDARTQLDAVSDSARLDAEILLARAIDVPRSYLIAHPEDTLDDAARERLACVLDRRIAGEPMAYITGIKEFWSLELMVSPATLIPRPESELMVELALREIPRTASSQVLDLGTGSGAIALAIASERVMCEVTATDIDPDALAVARQNARQLSIGNITFVEGNWTEAVTGLKFDVVVSNPPYVRDGDHALKTLRFEPRAALVGGRDGLDAIRVLARDCEAILSADGILFLEHGAEQHRDVEKILLEQRWSSIECHSDLAGQPRVTMARKGQSHARSGKLC